MGTRSRDETKQTWFPVWLCAFFCFREQTFVSGSYCVLCMFRVFCFVSFCFLSYVLFGLVFPVRIFESVTSDTPASSAQLGKRLLESKAYFELFLGGSRGVDEGRRGAPGRE